MTELLHPLPEACAAALAEIERSPLELTAVSESHVRACVACAEARVAWLAQEDCAAEAPPGYFDRLPDRILSKLPSAPRRLRPHLALWALAAALLLMVGAGGFWAGRANRTPLVEATLTVPAADGRDSLPDTPFQDGEEEYAQLPNLSPEQAHTLIERVSSQDDRP
jgi:hypothetical protein